MNLLYIVRASKIRKLFGLTKEDDVRKFVIHREIAGKKKSKAPRIQRLITATRLQRKRHLRVYRVVFLLY